MPTTVKLRYLRIAPRKMRQVSDLVRGKSAKEAQALLNFTAKRAAFPLLKLLKQAVANIKQSSQLEEGDLYISRITVDEGPKLKRWMPRARGQVSEIQKKTSHVTLILEEVTAKKPKKTKKLKRAEKAEKIKTSKKDVERPKEKPPKESKRPTGQAKLRPEMRFLRPKAEKGIKRVFKRKAF